MDMPVKKIKDNRKNNLSLLIEEVSIGVSSSSFLSGVTIFFTGLLITQINSFDPSIKIPILFLIISTFSFLYATLIYSNASGEITRLSTKKFYKCMVIGNIIGEYPGVYLLILAIPLVINAITTDAFLQISTLAVSLIGLATYQFSCLSLMERHFSKYHKVFLIIIALLEITLFVAQRTNSLIFTYTSVVLILFIFLLALSVKGEKENPD